MLIVKVNAPPKKILIAFTLSSDHFLSIHGLYRL